MFLNSFIGLISVLAGAFLVYQAYQLRKLVNQNTFALVETYNLRGNL